VSVDILGNADTYLTFNEKNEVLCGSCTGYNRPKSRARVVYLDGRDDPYPTNAAGQQRLHIEVDGKYIAFGSAKCGVHDRAYTRTFQVNPNMLTNDPLLDFDVLHRAYIIQRDEEQRRQQSFHDDYVAGLRRTAAMTEDEFTIEYTVLSERRGGGTEVTIKGPSHDEPREVAKVTLDNDYGVWSVHTVEYGGHTGRGRGSPAIARIIGRLLIEMADSADELNRREQS